MSSRSFSSRVLEAKVETLVELALGLVVGVALVVGIALATGTWW